MRYLLAAMTPRSFLGSAFKSIGKIVGGALPFLAPVVGALVGREGQKEANVASAQQAQQQMDFQERMSNTAHQREVADLRAAGLNPLLSGTGGAGAATPSGGMAKMENIDENTAATAQQIALNMENFKNLKETNKQIRADTTQKVQAAYLTSAQAEQARQEGELILQRRLTEKENTQRAHHESTIAANSAKGSELEGNIDDTRYGAIMRYIDRAMRSLQGGSSAIRNIK